VVEENINSKMELIMKDNGKMIKYMDLELFVIKMESFIKDNFKTIKWMDMENLYGQMVENILEII